MKKSDSSASYQGYDFSQPMRQSYAAIILIAYRLYKILIRNLFPFILVFLFGGSLKEGGSIIYLISAVAILGAIYSVISFFKYYFYLEDGNLIVQKGVLKRSMLEIPFDRIQSINFEQNVLHRVFNVVKLNMDTAGSSGSELQLNALNHDMASALSNYILSHKTNSSKQESLQEGNVSTSVGKKIIFNLTIPQLLKVGITANHLRSGALIIFFFLWIGENLRDIGLDVEEKMEDYVPVAEAMSNSLIIVSIGLILFMMIAFVISLVRTVLKYYDLNMYRIGDGFVIESGLLNRKEHAAKDDKIQLLSWSQNLLQKWGKIFELKMKQASSVEVSDKQSIIVAGLDAEDIENTENYLFKQHKTEIDNMTLQPVDKYYRYKKFFYRSLFLWPVIGYFIYNDQYDFAIYTVVFYVILMIGAHLAFTKKRYGLSDSMVVIRGGTWGQEATMLLLHKIQNVMLTQTPFQSRRSLGSLVLFTASGSVQIPDIDYNKCREMQDYLLYKVESSKESWM